VLFALAPACAGVISQVAPGVRREAQTRYREALRAQFSREGLLSEFQQSAQGASAHEPQTLELGETYDHFQLTVPSGLPMPVKGDSPSYAESTVFGSEVIYFGGDQNQYVKVDCYRLRPEMEVVGDEVKAGKVVEIFTTGVNKQLTDAWTQRFAGATASSLAGGKDDPSPLNPEQNAALLELFQTTRVDETRRSQVSIAGCPGSKTLFASQKGYPLAARSEVLLHGSVLVNVIASGLTEEELQTGRIDELFRSIRFGD
jgi:hypothetical protein